MFVENINYMNFIKNYLTKKLNNTVLLQKKLNRLKIVILNWKEEKKHKINLMKNFPI